MDDRPKQRALTLKQELFIRHYIGQAKGNATEAARLAGYNAEGHSLEEIGRQVKNHPIVAARISEFVTDVAVSASEVLSELATVAMADWREMVIQIKDAQGNTVGARMDLKDKVRALELLGKYHKLFTDQVNVNGPTMKAVIGIDIEDV